MRIKISSTTRNKFIGTILTILFFIGVAFLLYPTFSDRWNKVHQTTVIAQYRDQVEEEDPADVQEQLDAARAFNEELNKHYDRDEYVKAHWEEYNSLLNEGNGIMGYIEIPQIQTVLPIYHGTDENVLQIATGHVSWSSLPVGGEGTHSVISGHTGLPSAMLFTDLTELKKGDLFSIHILGEVFYYEVDNIAVKLPTDTKTLLPKEGKDYCTLLTCTPYGVNSHRLLVRGRRISYDTTYRGQVSTEGVELDPLMVSFAAGLMMALLLTLGKVGLTMAKKKRLRSENGGRQTKGTDGKGMKNQNEKGTTHE